jgi:hypothetical protein
MDLIAEIKDTLMHWNFDGKFFGRRGNGNPIILRLNLE